MHLKMSSEKWRPFCLGLNGLNVDHRWVTTHTLTSTAVDIVGRDCLSMPYSRDISVNKRGINILRVNSQRHLAGYPFTNIGIPLSVEEAKLYCEWTHHFIHSSAIKPVTLLLNSLTGIWTWISMHIYCVVCGVITHPRQNPDGNGV